MARNYAPQAERLKAVIAREKQMPAVFLAARANLKNPPKIYTEDRAANRVRGSSASLRKTCRWHLTK